MLATIIIKLIIGVMMASLIIKVTGRTTLAPQSPIDQIQSYILGGIIGGVIYSKDISIFDFIVVMFVWGMIAYIFYFLKETWPAFQEFWSGKRINVIEDGHILTSKLKSAQLSIDDIYDRIRSQGVRSITDIELATLETNGSLSLIMMSTTDSIYLVISEKKLNDSELKRGNISSGQIKQIVTEKYPGKTIDDILALEMTQDLDVNYIEFVQ